MDCFIFTGGNAVDAEKLEYLPKSNDFIIAADSGTENFLRVCKAGAPNIILGDMDSGDFEKSKKAFPQSEFIIAPCEKDDTDTMLAVNTALERGFKNIFIIGGIGSRLDHTFACAFSLKYIFDRGSCGIIQNNNNTVSYLENSKISFSKHMHKHKYISIVPMSEVLTGVYIRGFKYPLTDAVVNIENVYTVSNELISESGEMEIKSGRALIIESDD